MSPRCRRAGKFMQMETEMPIDTPIFDPIGVDGISEAVASQIENLIISGVLKSGQRLPSAQELADETGVSRPSAREAIKILESRGLLTVQPGEGTFVSALTGTILSPAMIDLFARHPDAFSGYLEFRREFESFAAFTAAKRATEEDLAIIRDILTRMATATDDVNPEEEARLNVKFHTAIVDGTHNPMLIHTMASIYQLFERGVFLDRTAKYYDPSRGRVLLAQHQKIGDAIFNRDPETAAVAAEEHVLFVEESYRNATKQERRSETARKRKNLSDRGIPRTARRVRS